MDPISGALHQQQAETALKVQMSVLRKNMDVQQSVGELLVGLIEGASPQAVKKKAKTVGLGENFDAFA
jgi:hypothetical protein